MSRSKHIFADYPPLPPLLHSHSMPELLAALDAFMQEHRRCADVDSRVEDGYVWMACDCGAAIVHPVEPPKRD